MKKNISKFDYFVLSFREIWKFDKLLFIVLLTDVVINALLPFPNIILSGLIIETLTEGSKFLSFAFYVGLMFSMNFLLKAVSCCLRKVREYLFLKFTDKINNDVV